MTRLLWNPGGKPRHVLQVNSAFFGVDDGEATPWDGPVDELQEIRAPSAPDFPTEFFAEVVGVAEIAQRAGVEPSTIHKWRSRHDDFPAPFASLAAGPVWLWESVARWLSLQPPLGRPSRSVTVKIPTAFTSVMLPVRATGERTYRLRDRFEPGSLLVLVNGQALAVDEGGDGRSFSLDPAIPRGETLELRYRSRLG